MATLTNVYAGYSIAVLAMLLAVTSCAAEPVYTIHYVRSYRRDLIDANFGCGKAIVYGTYLYPMGAVDALYALTNSHIYGINAQCQRKDTFVKLFGDAQDYQQLVAQGTGVADQVAGAIGRSGTRKVVLEWKYLPEASKRGEARNALETLVNAFKGKSFTVFVKAPASYFCLTVDGKKYLLDLPVENFIVQLYGEEAGKYTTYDSIFGNASSEPIGDGYSAECPKYPTKSQLQASKKNIYFEKTMDSSLPGYIGAIWEQFLDKSGAGKDYLYFYDGYPFQTVDF